MMMTDEQMNEFLESIGGLKRVGRFGDTIIASTNFFECNSGWNLIIKDLIEDLIELGWDKRIIQIKEKFGGLRFYIDDGSDKIYNRISLAEKQSYETCEKCGEKGDIRQDIGWYLTLCNEHYNQKKDEINNRNIQR